MVVKMVLKRVESMVYMKVVVMVVMKGTSLVAL